MSKLTACAGTLDNAAVHPILPRWSEALRRWYRRWRRQEPVHSAEALRLFLQTRTSHVAQMTLYGYLRARAGTRFPELFDNDAFVASVDIAKWHVWLACLADLSIYAGSLLRRNAAAPAEQVATLMRGLVDQILRDVGSPAGAGPEFANHAQRVRARVALCDWSFWEEEAAFVESPAAVVYWAPIVDDLKALDEDIVRNSVRFRWHEVRRELNHNLDPAAVLASATP